MGFAALIFLFNFVRSSESRAVAEVGHDGTDFYEPIEYKLK